MLFFEIYILNYKILDIGVKKRLYNYNFYWFQETTIRAIVLILGGGRKIGNIFQLCLHRNVFDEPEEKLHVAGYAPLHCLSTWTAAGESESTPSEVLAFGAGPIGSAFRRFGESRDIIEVLH
jgi:hypothetical protein